MPEINLSEMTIGELADLLVEMDNIKARKEDSLKALNQHIDKVKEAISDLFEKEGLSSVKSSKHNRTIYKAVRFFVGFDPDNKQDIIEALKSYGLDELLSCNRTQLTAWVREIGQAKGVVDKDGTIIADSQKLLDLLPDEFHNLKIGERVTVSVRK